MRNSIHMRRGFGFLFGCAVFVAILCFPQFVKAEVLIDPQLDCVLTRGFMTEVRTTRFVRGIKQTAHRTDLSSGEKLPVFLLGNPDLAQLAQLGIEPKTRAGRIFTATISPDVISRLAQVDGLEAIRLAKYTKPLLDVSVPAVQADHVRELMKDDWTGHTGEGVVIGIIDSGIDTTHPDFQNPDGSTRIAYYWAQGDDFGPTPSIGYGSEWDAAAINASAVTKPDDIGHGTHVAGIAAGNGRATGGGEDPYRFPGLAPEASIIMVATDFREDHLVDAIDYIFDKALAMGYPAVVNMSLGTQAGPHDGTAAVDQAIDALSGSGKVVVAAAGNEGNDRIHAEIALAPAEEDSASLSAVYFPANPDTTFNFFNVEGYYDRTADLCVTVVTPGGARFGPYELGAVQADTLTGEGTLFLTHVDPDPLGDTFQVIIEISDTETFEGPSVPPANGVWQFVFSNKGASAAEVDLWMPLAFPMTANWTDQGYDQSEEVGSPGTAFRAITVGSFNTKRCWDNGNPTQQCTSISESLSGEGLITWFSSHGPTRDGRQKPDLVAPGFVIAAAKSSGIAPELESLYGFPGTIDADGVHFYQAGTSMSAPHVTGAVALLLAAEPNLTPEEVRTRLIDSSTQDEFTGEGWSPDGGHGKLNVAALLNVTPLAPSGLRLSAETGVLEVVWEQTAPYQALAFRLERRAAGANLWERVGIFHGPGPHRHRQSDLSPASYRLYASMRTGSWELWGEASWSGVLEPVLAVGPNPFSDGLEFSHPLARAEVLIFDLQGRVVRRFEGAPSVPQSWDGRDQLGQPVPAGVYWIRVQNEDQQLTKRILRLP